jgi:hypothetical protein
VPKRQYGIAHQLRRKEWAPFVAAGTVPCTRCGRLIKPGTLWDLGHRDESGYELYSGPEHRLSEDCPAGGNRATARHRYLRRLKVSRQW